MKQAPSPCGGEPASFSRHWPPTSGAFGLSYVAKPMRRIRPAWPYLGIDRKACALRSSPLANLPSWGVADAAHPCSVPVTVGGRLALTITSKAGNGQGAVTAIGLRRSLNYR